MDPYPLSGEQIEDRYDPRSVIFNNFYLSAYIAERHGVADIVKADQAVFLHFQDLADIS